MAVGVVARTASVSKIGIARERYSGWLDVVRTISGTLDSYRTESVIDFDGGWAELQRFAWTQPLESVWHTDDRCYFLSLALDGLEEAARRHAAPAPSSCCSGRRVLLVPPGQTITSISATSGQRRVLRCLIDADLVERILPASSTAEERVHLGGLDFSGGTIEWLLFRMYREISASEIGVAVAVECIARAIAVEVARTIEQGRQVSRRRLGGLPSWRMRLLQERVHAEGPLPKVSDLAEIAGMTVRHLGRAFQAETGKTIGKFIASAMVERACRLLEAGVPVGAVAAMLGYSTSSSFAHAFHRETGILPSTIREGRACGTAA